MPGGATPTLPAPTGDSSNNDPGTLFTPQRDYAQKKRQAKNSPIARAWDWSKQWY